MSRSGKIIIRTGLALLLLAMIALAAGPGLLERQLNRVEQHPPYSVSEAARQLHSRAIIGDWHADSLLWNRDLSRLANRGQLDIPRMQAGNVALQMFTTVTKSPVGLNYHSNKSDAADNITRLALLQRWPRATWNSLTARAVHQANKLRELTARHGNDIMLITNRQQLSDFLQRRAVNKSLVGALLGTEGSHALDGKLENIDLLYQNGFRMMSLQHFFDNKLGGSLHGISHSGLTEFGRQAVQKMQSLDIIVDVSHSSEQTVKDVLAISSKPLVVSHTGFRGHCDSPRNIRDALMREIAQAGGLIAVGYWDGAVCRMDPTAIVEAIRYGIGLVGEDHVALGSDFDGSVMTAIDTGELVILTHLMLESGMSEQAITKVLGGNMLRFLRRNLPKK